MPQAETVDTTLAPRRALLAGSGFGLALVALLLPTAPDAGGAATLAGEPQPDAELVAAADAFIALEHQKHAVWDGGGDEEGTGERRQAVCDQLAREQTPFLDRILASRATTDAGYCAKARSFAAELPDWRRDLAVTQRGRWLLSSLLDDLLGLP